MNAIRETFGLDIQSPSKQIKEAKMRFSRRFLLVGLLAVLAGASVGPSTAAAVEEQPHFIKKGVEITETRAGSGKLNEFFILVPVGFSVLCTGIDNKVVIGAKWRSKLLIEFTKCAVFIGSEELTQCKVTEPIKIALRDQLVYKAGKKGEEIYDVFFPEAGAKFTGSTFAVVEITGALCTVKGTYTVLGSAIAVPSPNEPGKEARVIKLNFNGEGAPIATYFNHENSKEEQAGALSYEGKASFLKGSIEQELASKETYGAA